MKDVAVVSYCRTGIAKAGRGALNGIPMAAHVLRNAVKRADGDRGIGRPRYGGLLVFGAPCQLRLLAEQEHGQDHP